MLKSEIKLAGNMNGHDMSGKLAIRNGLPDVIERFKARREAEARKRGDEKFKMTLTMIREEINTKYDSDISYPALHNWATKELRSADLRLLAIFCDYFDVGVDDILVLTQD